jgi:ribonuclease D
MQQDSLITQPGELEGFCRALRSASRVAVDTEFVPEKTYTPVLCLIQAATGEWSAAIDPQSIADLTPFWRAILRSDCELVVHSGREELLFCRSLGGKLPERLFDLQVAAGLAGLGFPVSHTELVRRLLGIELRRPQTRTDWSRRPLSRRQVQYAIDDVRFLLPMCDRLAGMLDDMNRTAWLDEEMNTTLRSYLVPRATEQWRAVPGVGRLTSRELAVLRELFGWRAQQAETNNRPQKRILPDHLLVEIARAQPDSQKELTHLRGVAPYLTKAGTEGLLAAVRRGLNVPQADCPARYEERKRSQEQEMVVKVLSAALIDLSRASRVAPSLLGTKDDLLALLDWHAGNWQGGDPPRLVHGWRAAVCGQFLTDLLDGRSIIRIQHDSAGGPRIRFERPVGDAS